MNKQVLVIAQLFTSFAMGECFTCEEIMNRWNISRATAFRHLQVIRIILWECQLHEFSIELIEHHYFLLKNMNRVRFLSQELR